MHFKNGTFLQSCAMAAAFFLAAAPKTAAQSNQGFEEDRNRNYAAIVVDGTTGKILYNREGRSRRAPASLTKIMTAYLTFEDIRAGKIDFDTKLKVSANAAYKKWTHIHLAPENRATRRRGVQETFKITVYDALLGLLVQSGNDVATVLAENLGKGPYPESDFVARMNAKAEELGMMRTHFTTPSGWPTGFPRSTALDMAILAQAVMQDFPEYYPLFAVQDFEFKGYTFHNHNSLLGKYDGMDGLKTGFTSGSGFNLVASAHYGDERVIAVLFGAEDKWQRHQDMRKLLDFGFAKLCDSTLVFNSRDTLRIPCRDPQMMEPIPINITALFNDSTVQKIPVSAPVPDPALLAPPKKPFLPFLRKKG